MKGRPFRRYLPWLLILLAGGGAACQLVNNASINLHIAFAEDQTAIFEDMRQMTVDADAADVEPLAYVIWYYPSGTKQNAGSRLDLVVERARQSAIREIISVLRTRTGLDLGDDPRPWIEKLKVPANR